MKNLIELINLINEEIAWGDEEEGLGDIWGKAIEKMGDETMHRSKENIEPEVIEEVKIEDEKKEQLQEEEQSQLQKQSQEEDEKKSQEQKQGEEGEQSQEQKQDEGQEEVEYKFGDKVLSQKEFDEIKGKIEHRYGEEFDGLPENIANKIFEDYLNIKEASKSADRRHQENAKTRKELDAEKEEFTKERTRYENERKEWERRKDELRQEKAELEKIKKIDLNEIEDDDERFKAIAKQEIADTSLKKMDSKMKDVENEIKLAIQREEGVYVKALINELQTTNPDLKTTAPIELIIQEFKNTGTYENKEELIKAKRIHRVLKDYYNDYSPEERTKLSIANYYEIEKHNLPPLGLGQASDNGQKGTKKYIDLKAESVKNLFKKAIESKKTPDNPKGVELPESKSTKMYKDSELSQTSPEMKKLWGVAE